VLDIDMINCIRDMISGSFAENLDVDLAALIWSVDAKEHCIPSASEINSALQKIGRYRIVRNSTGVKIESNNALCVARINETDIELSMNIYKSTYGLN
jgi:hypothetical protein